MLKKQEMGVEAVDLLALLHGDIFEGQEIWDKSAFLELFSMRGMTCWVATLQEEVAGFIMFRQICDEVEIITLGVLEEKRRLGVGRYLVGLLSDLVKERGASLFLEVRIDNINAKNLYFQMDFEEVGHRKAYYLDGTDALILKLK